MDEIKIPPPLSGRRWRLQTLGRGAISSQMMLMAKQAGGQRHGTDRSAPARRPVSIFFNHGDGDVVNLKIKMMTCQTTIPQHKKAVLEK